MAKTGSAKRAQYTREFTRVQAGSGAFGQDEARHGRGGGYTVHCIIDAAG